MACYPDAQTKAQKELDEVIGTERLPEWSDWDKLPYVRSCLKEALRCMTSNLSTTLGHMLTFKQGLRQLLLGECLIASPKRSFTWVTHFQRAQPC